MKFNIPLIANLLATYILVPLLLGGDSYVMSLIIASLIIGGIALSWALLGNLGGMVSFGHSAFFGVGAYASALVSTLAQWPFAPALAFGTMAGVAASFALALPTMRFSTPGGGSAHRSCTGLPR